jgi:hypothetical protein
LLHQKAEDYALATALSALQDAVEAYNGSRTVPLDASANDSPGAGSKLKLYNTAKTANDALKKTWDDQIVTETTAQANYDAAVVECTDVTKLYTDQVALVGAQDDSSLKGYKKVKKAGTAASGTDKQVTYTPKGGSAITTDVLGIVLANAEIALAAEIATTNTKLENSDEYKAWKAKADDTVQFYKLFKTAKDANDGYYFAGSTFTGTLKAATGGAKAFACETSTKGAEEAG